MDTGSGAETPVGAVLAYAGTNTKELEARGWRVCDGRALHAAEHPELFERIGYANGGSGGTFNLPDLRGQFLRGTDRGAGRDPEAAARTAPAAGGSSGDLPGSVQGYATALPRAGLAGTFPNLPSGSHEAYEGSGHEMSKWTDSTHTVQVTAGGDRETRPVNSYVHFIIKAAGVVDGVPVTLPAGCVIPFAGPGGKGLGDEWLLCDGTAMMAGEGNRDLEHAIGISHGGSEGTFYLPDYRGWFLRGVSGGSRSDPDAEARTAPQPSLPSGSQGASGDQVGSVQGGATARPVAPFTATLPHLPTGRAKVLEVEGHRNSRWHEGAQDVNPSGSDHETRPVNLYLDWYIRAR